MKLDPVLEFRQWFVLQVIWPHGDGSSKARPAILLVTEKDKANAGEVLWFMKITGEKFYDAKYEIEVDPNLPQFETMGLTKNCYIYPELSKQIPKSNAVGFRGVVSDNKLKKQIWVATIRLLGLIG